MVSTDTTFIVLFQSDFYSGADQFLFIYPVQVNSTTSETRPALERITVSLLIRSWMDEQAGSSEPTSSHTDPVNTSYIC